MIQVFRIINGIDKLDSSHYFTFNSRQSRVNSQTLVKPRALTSVKQFSFSHRVVNHWNRLPDNVVLADSINMFKNRLEIFWKDIEYKYDLIIK